MLNKVVTLVFIGFFSICIAVNAKNEPMRTRPLSPDIKTICVMVNDEWRSDPVIELNRKDIINIKFDKLTIDNPELGYKIVHCNRDWTPSSLAPIEYIQGFADSKIDNYRFSVNTTVNYINYKISLPDNGIKFLKSGNYTVVVYELFTPEKPLLYACFSIVEPMVSIKAFVQTNTMVDSNDSHQQLDFEINYSRPIFRNPQQEVNVEIRQNRRLDNVRRNVKPNYIQPQKMIFKFDKNLLFDAGNEYRRFETTSRLFNGIGVSSCRYITPYYNVFLYTDKIRARKSRVYDIDQNGRFLIRNEDAYDSDIGADYFYLNFKIESPRSSMMNPVYLYGDFTYNTFGNSEQMKYDKDNDYLSVKYLLKQGAYNYIYLQKIKDIYSSENTEGNYFETENEYTIFVYHRPQGARYDSLIGWTKIGSDN